MNKDLPSFPKSDVVMKVTIPVNTQMTTSMIITAAFLKEQQHCSIYFLLFELSRWRFARVYRVSQ